MTRIAAITGATGFLGRHVLETLTRSGWHLRLLVRQDPRLMLGERPVELIPGTLRDEKALGELVSGVDAVIHLAGLIKAPSRRVFAAVNIDGTRDLVTAWRNHCPDARFVMVSTLAAREPEISDYAWSKAEAEKFLQATDGQWCILRPSAVYGPGDRETLSIFKAAQLPLQPLLNDGDARVALVHAKDVARAVEIAASTDMPNQTYEVSDGNVEGYSWPDIATSACAAMDRSCKPWTVPTSVTRTLGFLGDIQTMLTGKPQMISSKKVREILHNDWGSMKSAQLPEDKWMAKIALPEGFRETVEWYRANNWLR